MLLFFCILVKTNLATAKDLPTHDQELTVQKKTLNFEENIKGGGLLPKEMKGQGVLSGKCFEI